MFLRGSVNYEAVVVDVNVRCRVDIQNSLRVSTERLKDLRVIIIDKVAFHEFIIHFDVLFLIVHNYWLGLVR
jgi:hypothetical protein